MKKEFIRLSSVLCLITLVAALLLAGVNKITAPRIAEAEEKASVDAMKKIIPDADSFEAMNENVTAAKKGDKTIGFCTKVTTVGYGGDISMMVGIDTYGTVCGIEILSHNETAGLGANITNDDFKKTYTGAQVPQNPNDKTQIATITGATISSRAVANGVKMADELVAKAVEEARK